MSELYLVAHKVRGEPAFDVAERMPCPSCDGFEYREGKPIGCHECDSLGYWWIIPTSGHRAYPYAHQSIKDYRFYHDENDGAVGEFIERVAARMPPNLPDHYRTRAEPSLDLTKALGLKPKPLPPIVRRL